LLLYGHECAGREIGVDHRKRAFEYVVHRLDLRRKLVASLHETTLASDTLVKTIEGKTAALATIPRPAPGRDPRALTRRAETLSFPGILAGACEMAPAVRRCAHLPDHPGARAQTTRPSPLHPAAP
jgi:hypothetical protein